MKAKSKKRNLNIGESLDADSELRTPNLLNTQSSNLSPQSSPRFRFVVMGALWMTAFFLFLDRVNISLAAPYIMDDLGLSGIETGLILSSYYWGYILGQLSGGVASDRLSIRKWSSLMFAGWCVLTHSLECAARSDSLLLSGDCSAFRKDGSRIPSINSKTTGYFPTSVAGSTV